MVENLPVPLRKEGEFSRADSRCDSYRPGSVTNWNALTKAIEDILGNSDLNGNLAIAYDIGSVSLAAGNSLVDTHARSPKSGSSIGLDEEPRATGTLGGYLYLDFPDGKRELCGLTCHHVILPSDEDNAKRINANRVNINNEQDPGRSRVRYPSLFDIDREIRNAEKASQSLQQQFDKTSELIEKEMVIEGSREYQDWTMILQRKSRTDQRLADFRAMRAKGPFGLVLASSGMRMGPHGNRLDWSLLKVKDDTFHVNYAPPAEDLSTYYNPDGVYAILPNEAVSRFSIPPLSLNSFTIKNGRSTGVTTGRFASIRPDVQWEKTDVKSTEWELVRYKRGSVYCERGDSGAFVLDKDGALCGLLIGQHVSAWSQQHGAGIATPIDDILDDVRMRTGGTLHLPCP
jgi:hypothetical protein